MLISKFYLNVLVRVIFIVLSSMVLGIILPQVGRGYYYTLAGMAGLILLQTWFLVQVVNRTNTDLERFLSTMQDQDCSVRFSGLTDHPSFAHLHNRMNHVLAEIQHLKINSQRKDQLLTSLTDQADTGLLAIDMDGSMVICNPVASRYLGLKVNRNHQPLNAVKPDMLRILETIEPGQEVLYKQEEELPPGSILIRASVVKYESTELKLVSFQDITRELDRKEVDSWQKLIRVLTHEIMNSISPITSLTSVISGYFRNGDQNRSLEPSEINSQTIAKTLSGLETIEETGKGLLEFVDKYRSLTILPKPEICRFRLDDLLMKCAMLMEQVIPSRVELSTVTCPADLTLDADYCQVEMVLINLIKNAAEALEERSVGFIRVQALAEDRQVMIRGEDNGNGIAPEHLENIFVPFFTTRAKGTGIGLSLARQVMQQHGGTISVNSEQGSGSVFMLKFPVVSY